MRIAQGRYHRRRTGSTTLIVIVALAILGALVARGFLASWREAQIGADSIARARALAAAEYGAYSTLSPTRWLQSWNVMAPVHHTPIVRQSIAGDAAADVTVWKLTPTTALISSLGSAGQLPRVARQRVGLLVALHAPVVARLGAATARARITVADSSRISGLDATATDCAPPESTIAALVVADTSAADIARCTSSPCLVGTPPIRIAPEAESVETYEQFGQVDRSFLSKIGTLIPEGSVLSPTPIIDSHGECDARAPGNFGDPLRVLGADSPCKSFFALGHAQGDLRLVGGTGQGMLVVDGDLTLKSAARFDGVIIARGSVWLESGSQVMGIVLAANIALEGGSIVQYSSCAIDRALVVGARPVPQPGQSWTEMF